MNKDIDQIFTTHIYLHASKEYFKPPQSISIVL